MTDLLFLVLFPVSLAMALLLGNYFERRGKVGLNAPTGDTPMSVQASISSTPNSITSQMVDKADCLEVSEPISGRSESEKDDASYLGIRERIAQRLPDFMKGLESEEDRNLRYRKTRREIDNMSASERKTFYLGSLNDPCLHAVFRCGKDLIQLMNAHAILDEFHRQIPVHVSSRSGRVFIDDEFKLRKELPSARELKDELKHRRESLRDALLEEYKAEKLAEKKQIRSQPGYYSNLRFLILKILACVALLFSFADMPKGYYQLLRWTVCAAALGALWENANSSRSEGWKTFVMFFFGAMAITFNPVLPIHFDRDVWEVLDVVALAGLAASAFFRPAKHPNPTPPETP